MNAAVSFRRAGLALAALLPAALAATAFPARAADVAAGRDRAQQCATCHGPNGMATMPLTPHLAGQPDGYLSAQLKAFRSGKRQHEIMSLIAKPLTDEDIANLSAYYASLQVALVEKP